MILLLFFRMDKMHKHEFMAKENTLYKNILYYIDEK